VLSSFVVGQTSFRLLVEILIGSAVKQACTVPVGAEGGALIIGTAAAGRRGAL